MPFQKILLPLAALALLVFAFYRYSWAGLAVASGALVMWLLLHFSRMMQILKRAESLEDSCRQDADMVVVLIDYKWQAEGAQRVRRTVK